MVAIGVMGRLVIVRQYVREQWVIEKIMPWGVERWNG